MKYDIILWPRTCAVFRMHYHINAMKRCCERTRTARRRALCGRRRLRHAAAILLRQANGIAPAWYRRKPTNVTDVVRSFRRTTTNQPPFRLFSRNCRAFRFDCFLISNSTFLSTIARSIDVQSTSFSNLSGHFIVSFIVFIKISLILFFLFLFFFIACAMYYVFVYNMLIIVINIVS